MVSVIIPTYNRRDMVVEALRTVFEQKEVPDEVEVIVVDDGSTDGTAEALASFGEKIKYFRVERAGVSAARNRGIAESRGDYVAFLDSDDLWLHGKLSAQMRYFHENPGKELCQTEEIWIRNGRRLNQRKYHKKPQGHCFGLLLERCLVSPSAVVVRRSLLYEAGLFDESLPACEDYDLWLRVGSRHPIGLIEEPLVIKRGGHPGQLSAITPALDKYRIRSISKLLGAGSLNAAQTEAALAVLRKKCRIYAQGCRKRGNAAEAEMIEALALPVVYSL